MQLKYQNYHAKFIVQLRCNRWADLLNVFHVFSCKIRDPHMLSHPGIKVTEGSSVISNVAVTTPIATNYSRAEFFLN